MIVWPSGGDFTTISVPIVPEAPGLFSTKNGWSQRACSLGASKRATMSGPAAGVNGTTIRTGRLESPCASANGETAAAASAQSTRRRDRAGLRFMRSFSSSRSEDYKGRPARGAPRQDRTLGTLLVERPRESAPAQQLQGFGPFGHDVGDSFGDQLVGLVIFRLADRSGEAELRDEQLVAQAGGVDVVGQAGAVLERKAAEIGEAAEHRPDTGREFRFDAAELRIQIHDLSHFSVPSETLGYRRLTAGPIGQNPVGAFQKPDPYLLLTQIPGRG